MQIAQFPLILKPMPNRIMYVERWGSEHILSNTTDLNQKSVAYIIYPPMAINWKR